jgi:hypothetical protein
MSKKIEWDKESLQKIEQNSYFKWVDAGKPNGRSQEFWNEAEQELIQERHYDSIDEEVIEVNFRPKTKKQPWFYGDIPLDIQTEYVHVKTSYFQFPKWMSQIT